MVVLMCHFDIVSHHSCLSKVQKGVAKGRPRIGVAKRRAGCWRDQEAADDERRLGHD